MITTVTLNAAVDKTYYLSSFEEQKVNRVSRMYSEPGGKGINVAKVLQQLGTHVMATGFVGGFNGKYICTRLDNMGIEHRFVTVEGESRLCLNIIDETRRSQTEILESGPVISADEWERLKEQIDRLAAKSEFVVFSGSLPKGLKQDAYAELTRIVHQHDAKPIVDTSGVGLQMSLKEKPFMVKPNRDELISLMETDSLRENDILEVMGNWGEQGIPLVIVSLGSEGSLVSHNGEFFKVTPPVIEAVNAVGSGDAMVAGIAAGLASGLSTEETLTLATAVAAANALEHKAGSIDPHNVNTLKEKVHINRI